LVYFINSALLLAPFYFGINLTVGAWKKFDSLRVKIVEQHNSTLFKVTAFVFTAWVGILTFVMMIAEWAGSSENANVILYSKWIGDLAGSILTIEVSAFLILLTILLWMYSYRLTNDCLKMKLFVTLTMVMELTVMITVWSVNYQVFWLQRFIKTGDFDFSYWQPTAFVWWSFW
jgi:hypothetical protein